MSGRRVLVTGSRFWSDRQAVFRALDDQLKQADGLLTVVHGAAAGADTFAGCWAAIRGHETNRVAVEPHPAEWHIYGKSAGPMRNQEMVDLGADVCLAFPKGDSRGTRHCMTAAAHAGIPVYDASVWPPVRVE